MIADLPLPIALTVFAAFGAVVGSFLNVVIYRLPLGKSVVWPASGGPHCSRGLSWYENIPVLSWLALRGRCRTCGGSIHIRYPLVELLTAAMFALAFWFYGPGALLFSRLIFGCALLVLFAIDLEHQLLPNAITLPGIPIDPTSEPYLLTSEGRVRLSNASSLGPLPDETAGDGRPPA